MGVGASSPHAPTRMSMSVAVVVPTWRCNGKCSYCDYRYEADIHGGQLTAFGKTRRVEHEIGVEDWVKTLSVLGVTKVEITGGEPLLRSDFPKVLKQTGVKWAITSNSTGDINPWLDMCISGFCLGWSASLHPWTDRQQFKTSVNSLLAYRLPVSVTVVLQKNNLRWSKGAIRFAKAQGWRVVAHPEYDEGQAWGEIEREAATLAAKEADEIVDLWEWPKPDLMNCKAGTTYWAVGPDGRIWNCYYQMIYGRDESPPLCMSGCPMPCDRRYAEAEAG